ncbi:phasin family protein [Solilutibacter silvestris]|uniref:Phasin protein n=1 Tax=Solilutibacter silvestris TaxID=1645665 RepID=A0A2K1Q1W9_9GAMM|nr:phasin family protein [Lysobacter silvestris]PNS09035.1 Phasin protein [Lysobacter silvestris]
MYQQFNEQFAANTRQYAETAAHINRLAVQNIEHVFGLQLAAVEENTGAAFAFFNQLLDVRDLNGLREVVPAGVQIAREGIERSVVAGQEAYESTIKTNETIGQIAKGQFEQATKKATAQVEKVAKTAGRRK